MKMHRSEVKVLVASHTTQDSKSEKEMGLINLNNSSRSVEKFDDAFEMKSRPNGVNKW